MKRETLVKKKFNLDKFEVVRLSNMKNINGGDGGVPTGTETTTLSSVACKSLRTSISDTDPNKTNG